MSLSATSTLILSAEPQLFVTDIPRSCRFYEDKLGFNTAFTFGEPPFYAQVARDHARLNLRAVASPVFHESFRARETDALAATLTLEDAAPLYETIQRTGVTFHQELRREPWGAETFIVADPDANLICFAGRHP